MNRTKVLSIVSEFARLRNLLEVLELRDDSRINKKLWKMQKIASTLERAFGLGRKRRLGGLDG
jgi:hypothetical protein